MSRDISVVASSPLGIRVDAFTIALAHVSYTRRLNHDELQINLDNGSRISFQGEEAHQFEAAFRSYLGWNT